MRAMLKAVSQFPERHRLAALGASHGQERLRVVLEAWSWMHTPYLHENRLKRDARFAGDVGGADCGNYQGAVFAAAGLIEEPPLYKYPHDFYKHSDQEVFRDIVAGFCERVDEFPPLPADIIAVAFGKVSIAHLALVVNWPVVIHTTRGGGGVELDDGSQGNLSVRRSGVWRLKRWCEREHRLEACATQNAGEAA